MGYLGKISAVVSVNTGDFAGKMNACARDVKSFAASTERDLKAASRSAAKSFGSIYTEVQKLERSLRAATSLKLDFTGLKGFEGKGLQEAADHMRQIHSVAAQISAPLAEAAKKSESLALSIRGGIHPALESTQKAAEEMQSAVAAGTSISIRQFNELEAIVRKTSDAMNRVSQAGGMAGDLTGGKDFRTQSPQAFAALERAKDAQQSAYALPAGTISSAPALLARQKAAAMAVAAAYAAVESKRDLGQDQTKALADLKRKIDRLDQVNALIEKEVSGHNAAAAAIRLATAESNTLRSSLSKIADSIGEPAAPIDRAKLAIDRMNDAIKKLKDPSKKATAEGVARSIRDDIESEVAVSAATGIAPASGVIDRSARRANRLAAAVEGVNDAPPVKTADDIFGPAFGSSGRKIGDLKTKIASLHGELEKLPAPLIPFQNHMSRVLEKLRDDFAKLTPASTTAEIRKVTMGYEALERTLKKVNQAAVFKGSFSDFLKDTRVDHYTSQLQSIRTAMAGIGASASGPTARAVNAFGDALAKATLAGSLGTDAVRKKMQALVDEIQKAIVQEGLLSEKNAAAVIGGATRQGDVNKNFSGKLSLGLNQAAYIVDDFMSATGGAEQKLRAISNNITQLGFVVGSTTGLFVALGGVIAVQGYLALTKWINAGKTAEDQTKTLNDSLEKQKTLADSLAQSFESLADSIAQSSMSAESFAGKQLNKQLEGIQKQQKDAREEELYRLSPDVNAARASQNVADKKIKAATTESEMLAAQGDMSRAKAAEETAKSAARARVTRGGGSPETINAIAKSFSAEAARAAMLERQAAGGGGEGDIPTLADMNQQASAALRLAERFVDMNAGPGGDAGLLRKRMSEVGDRDTQFADLSRALATIELPLKESVDSVAVAVSRASSEAASKIKEAQGQVAEAIKAGTPGAAMFGVALNETAESLASAQDKIIAAVNETDPNRRQAMVEAAKKDVGALSQTIEQQLEASRGMMFGGLGVKGGRGGQLTGVRRVEGAGSVLAALEGSSSFGGQKPQMVAALRSLMTQEQSARSDLSRSMTFGNGGQRMQAAMRLEQVQQQLQQFTEGLPEDIKSGADAAKAATKEATKDAKTREEMVARGRELLASPKQRAMETFRKDMEAASLAAAGPDRDALLNSFVKNRAMEIAPALAELAREREQAITPAYSPALMASDASTAEGQKELNRLLRGEDSGKDKNLDELKKQSELLSEMLEVAKRDHNVVIDF